MTKSENTRDAEDNPIANMEGLQAAICNGETKRVEELLAGQHLDKLQKDYLIELAELNGVGAVTALLRKTPEKP